MCLRHRLRKRFVLVSCWVSQWQIYTTGVETNLQPTHHAQLDGFEVPFCLSLIVNKWSVFPRFALIHVPQPQRAVLKSIVRGPFRHCRSFSVKDNGFVVHPSQSLWVFWNIIQWHGKVLLCCHVVVTLGVCETGEEWRGQRKHTGYFYFTWK